jgi:nitrilase
MFDVCVNREDGEAYNESNTIVPGRDVVVAETSFAVLGLSICYDLRFPELYRELVSKGATVLTVPSAFTYTTGKRHWQLLLTARAVENLSFVIASSQGGQNTAKRKTWGHSMIIDPWGNILSSLEHGPGVACADIDLTRVDELRASFPALQHRILGI